MADFDKNDITDGQTKIEPDDEVTKSSSTSISAFRWFLVILTTFTMLTGTIGYTKALKKKRALIVKRIEISGQSLDNPVIKKKYKDIFRTYWLPNLNKYLESARKIPKNKKFPKNPEAGSYVDYIKRHNIPFDAKDAIEWQTNRLRG